MKIKILWLGNTKDRGLAECVADLTRRLSHYTKLEVCQIKEVRGGAKLPKGKLMEKEADLFLNQIADGDHVVLLDESGKQLSSTEVAEYLNRTACQGTRTLVFIIGGAFGVDDSVRRRANFQWSLSRLTFTHDMARVLLLEQTYRGFTILKGEKYHNP